MGRIFDLGVREAHTILIWGYAEGFNFDLGYTGTKRLRTPGLEHSKAEWMIRLSTTEAPYVITNIFYFF